VFVTKKKPSQAYLGKGWGQKPKPQNILAHKKFGFGGGGWCGWGARQHHPLLVRKKGGGGKQFLGEDPPKPVCPFPQQGPPHPKDQKKIFMGPTRMWWGWGCRGAFQKPPQREVRPTPGWGQKIHQQKKTFTQPGNRKKRGKKPKQSKKIGRGGEKKKQRTPPFIGKLASVFLNPTREPPWKRGGGGTNRTEKIVAFFLVVRRGQHGGVGKIQLLVGKEGFSGAQNPFGGD